MMEPNRRLSVAPMMDRTNRHERYFLRLISRRALLYTEMISVSAVLRGDQARLLGYDPLEHPLALQVGGAEPEALAASARIAEDLGYDEINLNVGCPSGRVQQARFGACLMAEPELVARCVAAMGEAADLPVTVKTRIGIDQRDSYEELAHFVRKVAGAGCRSFAIHARKAWLQGLSPKENREVPPLDYDRVYRLKQDFPDLEIVLNGGVLDLDQTEAHLARVDGVMIGRAAYQDPYVLAEADRRLFGDPGPAPSREEVVRALLPYAERQCAQGVPVKAITRHILGLFNGLSGARLWRRSLSEEAHQPGAGPEVIERALDMVVSRRAPSGSARLPMDAARHTTLVPPILSNR
jgi:tRNA-dihydrouridine synthase A